MSGADYPATVWTTDGLHAGLIETLEGGEGLGRWIHGRVVGVLGSPESGNARHLAFGVSALPAGFSTPEHHHAAEEIAFVLDGEGEIVVDGVRHPVGRGSIVLTPAESVHVTSAGPDAPLLVMWVYAPAGSEHRWLAPEQEKGTF